MQTHIKPGQVWLDTNGKPIQAHGFSVFYKDGTWYWYKEVHELPGVEVKHGENIAASRYAWLPIEWEGDKPVIRWQKEWKII